jgi:hypothetical protein
MAGNRGVEPRLMASKATVLPLDEIPLYGCFAWIRTKVTWLRTTCPTRLDDKTLCLGGKPVQSPSAVKRSDAYSYLRLDPIVFTGKPRSCLHPVGQLALQ